MKRGEIKPPAFVKIESQGNLFGTQPAKWSPSIDRLKIDLAMKTRIKEGRATYVETYNSFKCMVCNQTTDHTLYISNHYCMTCDILHDTDYVSNNESNK